MIQPDRTGEWLETGHAAKQFAILLGPAGAGSAKTSKASIAFLDAAKNPPAYDLKNPTYCWHCHFGWNTLPTATNGGLDDQLVADPSSARIGGARREMSVLFADIRSFTTFTERGRPEDVVSQLNEYFSRMVDVVFEHRGTLDKFVGDMVMALFGAPVADPEHADQAVQAALGMLGARGRLNARWVVRSWLSWGWVSLAPSWRVSWPTR